MPRCRGRSHPSATMTIFRTRPEFATAAEQAASARAASIVSAHTAGQIVSIATALAADEPEAMAVALACVGLRLYQ